ALARVVLLEHRHVGPLRDLARELGETEHPLERGPVLDEVAEASSPLQPSARRRQLLFLGEGRRHMLTLSMRTPARLKAPNWRAAGWREKSSGGRARSSTSWGRTAQAKRRSWRRCSGRGLAGSGSASAPSATRGSRKRRNRPRARIRSSGATEPPAPAR